MSYPYPVSEDISSTSPVSFESLDQQAHPSWSAAAPTGNNFEDLQTQMDAAMSNLYNEDIGVQQHLFIDTNTHPPISTLTPDSDVSSTPTQTPQTYEPPQVIQLVERRPRRTRQQQQHEKGKGKNQSVEQVAANISVQNVSSVVPPVPRPTQPDRQVHHQYSPKQSSPCTRENQTGYWFDMHDVAKTRNTRNQSAAERSSMSISQARHTTHPYQRRSVSGPSAINTNIQKTQGGEISPNSEQQTSSSTSSHTSQLPAEQTEIREEVDKKIPRYYIRTDVFFDGTDNTFTATLELPGVKKSQIKLSTAAHPRTNALLLIVRGHSCPLLPNGVHVPDGSTLWNTGYDANQRKGFLIRERKCGAFIRRLVLPPGTKPTDIKTNFQDGILYLKYPAGLPLKFEHKSSSASASCK